MMRQYSIISLLIESTCWACLVSFPQAYADEYKNDSEVGIVMTGGNSVSDSYSLKQISEYRFFKNNRDDPEFIRAFGDYVYADSRDPETGQTVETAFRWDAGGRYQKPITFNIAPFVAYSLQSDVYSGFLRRHNFDVGSRVWQYKNPTLVAFLEAGYRYSRQDNIDSTFGATQNARFYLEGLYNFDPKNSARLWLEYLPCLYVWTTWQLNGEASLNSDLNSKLSLKLAYAFNWTRPPVTGKKPLDTTFTTSIVAKF